MKKIIFCLSAIILTTNWAFSQCNTKTTHRPDGVTMEYFNPKPVIRKDSYEVGTAIYKNKSTGDLTLNISVLFKSETPQKFTGKAIIQTDSEEGLKLSPVVSRLMKMNGSNVALGLFLITKRDYEILKNNSLKSVFFHLEGDLTGNTVTENESILENQLDCFKF